MNVKWYFSILLLVILLGVGNKQSSRPNQEIVLQFSDPNTSSAESQSTLVLVKEQLEQLGAINIKVVEDIKGKLKITYFSSLDITQIKSVLLNKHNFCLNVSNSKESTDSQSKTTFDLDIYEIHSSLNSNINLEGTLAIEIKADAKRNYSLKLFSSLLNEQIGTVPKSAVCKVYSSLVFYAFKTAYKIPEVRAGPMA